MLVWGDALVWGRVDMGAVGWGGALGSLIRGGWGLGGHIGVVLIWGVGGWGGALGSLIRGGWRLRGRIGVVLIWGQWAGGAHWGH